MELMEDSLTVCPHCGYDEEMTDERLDQLKPGSLLKERFTIGRPLGRGGFGITYIAWDNSLQRKVAIKEYLPRGLASREPGNTTVSYDAETKEAFLRGVDKTLEESRRLAGFTELESVVNVYDCFKENGTAYIVMEVLKGENAKKRLERAGVFSFDETVRIMTPVLETLEKVHKTGIIHRDISPDNIYICDNGKVKLLDFGSARIADNTDEKSRSIVLKHGYAPKEQYTTKGKQGPFTDIYSVCATIYKMLTGVTPVESLERINDEDELQDISELVKIPLPAAKAIMKGMAVNASDRIQSAGELLAGLTSKEPDKPADYDDFESTVTLYVPKGATASVPDDPVKADEMLKTAVPVKPAPIKESADKQRQKKSPVIKIIAIVAALAIVIGAVAFALGNRRIVDYETTTTQPDTTTEPPTSETETESANPDPVIDSKLWKKAFYTYYNKKFSSSQFEFSDFSKLYVIDLDGDNIPEIIDQPTWFPTIVYYDTDRDKAFECDIPENYISSYPYGEYPNMLYFDKENHCIIERCDTTTLGTMMGRNAAIYSYKNGKLTEVDSFTVDFDESKYDLSDTAGQEKADKACRDAFDKQYKEFVKGRKLEDFGKVAISGGDEILKKLNAEFADKGNELTTIPVPEETEPQFDIGRTENRIYYNEWANLQFNLPNGWNDESYNIDSGFKTDGYTGGFRFAENSNTGYKDSVTIVFYENGINDVIDAHAAGTNRVKENLANEEWTALKASKYAGGGLVLLRVDEYKVQYYRQIDDYVVLIEIVSYSSDKSSTYADSFYYYSK